MDGVVVVDKAPGPTSMRVVERLRRIVGVRKAGHGGTLDPAASGVLPVLLGRATRLVPFLHDGDKEYFATVRLGLETDSLDLEGEVTARRDVPPLEVEDLAPHLAALTGPILQRPPAFSAIRVAGERLYDRARRGEPVECEPRPVVVHAIEVLRLAPPEVDLRVRCGKGTYVRVLAADLGAALGCGAVLAALRRTRVGCLDLARSVTLERLADLAGRGRVAEALIRPAEALDHLPAATLAPAGVARVRQGQAARPEDLTTAAGASDDGAIVRLLDDGGTLVAIAERAGELLRPRRVL